MSDPFSIKGRERLLDGTDGSRVDRNARAKAASTAAWKLVWCWGGVRHHGRVCLGSNFVMVMISTSG